VQVLEQHSGPEVHEFPMAEQAHLPFTHEPEAQSDEWVHGAFAGAATQVLLGPHVPEQHPVLKLPPTSKHGAPVATQHVPAMQT
jgi:hypothetical protein